MTQGKRKVGSARRVVANDRPGLAARAAAARLLGAVTERRASLDGLLDPVGGNPVFTALSPADRLLARAILLSVLRNLPLIDAAISSFLEKPLPDGAVSLRQILRVAATQILFLDSPDHSAVDLAVAQADGDPRNRRFKNLVNAVLRNLVRNKNDVLETLQGQTAHFPDWFEQRIRAAYPDDARAILTILARPASVDLTVKSEPGRWAERLGGMVLPNGTVRLASLVGPVTGLAGFEEGEWWVQDAAASLPARLFGAVSGLRIADLCAAPGGKTAQLVQAGASVTAVEQSKSRMERLRGNLQRLRLEATLVHSRAEEFAPDALFDGVLVDAPCSSTGTVRRHPDIPYTKDSEDIARLAAVQARLLDHASALVRPGGILVFSNCSLEPEEGEAVAAGFIGTHPDFSVEPVIAGEIPGLDEALGADGGLRTLPSMLSLAGQPELSGLDGFYAIRFRRNAP